MVPRRGITGSLAAAALLPALLWLFPALLFRQAPTFRDQGDFFYPLKLYTAGRLRAGEVPLWNPFSGCGEPWLANAQSGVFYPPTLLFLLPSPALAVGLFLLLHFAIGAWGMRRFLKGEGVTDAGALIGASVFTACGFAASLSVYWNHFGAAMYLPAIAASARSGLSSRAAVLGLALLVGLQAMAGSPELTGAALGIALALAFVPRRERPIGWSQPPRFSGLRRFVAATALGLALAAWVLVPLAELALNSDRRAGLSPSERDVGTVGAGDLASVVGLTDNTSGTSYLASLYLGPLPLLAALAAFAERQRRPLVLFLLLLAAGGILFAAAFPPGTWLRSVPPLDRLRYPAKALAVSVFGLAALAGLGADTLRFTSLGRRALLILAAGAAGLALLLFSPTPLPVRFATALGILALLLAPALRERFPAAAGWAQGAAALALLASLAWASRPLFRFAPESEISREPAQASFLAAVPGRVLTPPMRDLVPWVLQDSRFGVETLWRQREALLGYTNLLSGVRTVRTAAAVPTAAARRIADSIDSAEDLERAAGAASARLLWTPFQPANLGSRKVGDFFRAPLNPYRPRLSFVRGYGVEPDPARAWERASRGEIDPAREVLLGRAPAARAAGTGPAEKGAFVIARIAEDRPERVVAEVTSRSAGLLVLTDLAYPGWTAEEEGRPLEILLADGVFRAVSIPAGSHRVTFRYRPLSFYGGAALSVAALALILILLYQGEPIRVGRRA